MRKVRQMRHLLLASALLLGPVAFSETQDNVGMNAADVSGGFHMPSYPDLILVPGTPVYYAPHVAANFFFYDGKYWIYQSDEWYASRGYDGPWGFVTPDAMPVQVLRVPVLYYCLPPSQFRGWRPDAPPQWGDIWGRGWERSHDGWDRWDRNAVPPPALLPTHLPTQSRDLLSLSSSIAAR